MLAHLIVLLIKNQHMKFKINLKFALLAFITMTLITSCNQPEKGNQKETLDVSLIDTTFDPAEDFYHYANNGWLQKYPLPDDESRYGTFDQLAKETSRKVQDLVKGLANQPHEQGTIEQKIGDFYALGMDSATINEQGLEPLKGEFEKIAAISNIEDVQNQIAHFHMYDIGSLFGFYGSIDAKNSDMNIAQLSQSGLGMSDRDYYTNDDPRTIEIREAYVKHLEKMFALSGIKKKEAKEMASTVMEIETRLAKASFTRLENRDPNATYNKKSYGEIKERFSNFNWDRYISNMGLENVEEINVRQIKFFDEINKMMAEVNVDDWKTYFYWNLLNETANYVSSEFVEQNFDFYGKTMQGSEKMRPRWRRVLGATNGALGDAIGQKFTEKHFPPEAKERMVNLVENLRIALGQRIDNLEWMSDETKEKANEKLATIRVKIGYPDQWKDYSDLEITRKSYVTNVLAANKFRRQENTDKIGKPVDKEEWFMTPQTVNAYYAPSLNEICFPAGILQPPFFYLEGDDAINYGAIGAVIGHEMSHGFDDQGRLYDKVGNLESWWTEEDSKLFNARTRVLVDQYNDIIILDSLHADGELSLGENIADLGGLNIAYTAFKNAQKENPQAEMINGYTPDQRFFLSWARVWAQNVRDKEKIRRTKEDVHSLGINRVHGPIANMPEFHDAFNVESDDKLYIPKEERASIW